MQIYILSTALHLLLQLKYGTHNLQPGRTGKKTAVRYLLMHVPYTKSKNLTIPVSSLDSSSVSTFSAEYLGLNLAVVYLCTRSGPQGPKPLHTEQSKKLHKSNKLCYVMQNTIQDKRVNGNKYTMYITNWSKRTLTAIYKNKGDL